MDEIAKAQMKKIAIIGSIVVVGGVIVYFGVLNPLLKFLNVKDDKEDKEAKNLIEKARNKDYFSKTYYEGRENKLSLSRATDYLNIAKNIHDSWGLVNDDESKLNSTFSGIKNKVDLSYVSFQYNQKYDKDLLSDIESKLSNKEIIALFNILEGKGIS